MKYGWLTIDEFKWLSINSFDKEIQTIITILSRFKGSFVFSIKNDSKLNDYREPLKNLQEFFFSIAHRKRILNEENSTTIAEYSVTEKSILIKFSEVTSHLTDTTMDSDKKITKVLPIRLRVKTYLQSILERYTFKVAVFSAIFMTFGVIIFKINIAQAFLTWFTVTFGSITIVSVINYYSTKKYKAIITEDVPKS